MVVDFSMRENISAKLAYLAGTFVRISSTIKPALQSLHDEWTTSLDYGYSVRLNPVFVRFLDLVDFFLNASDPPSLLPLLAPAPPPPTTSLSSTLEADITDDPVVLNIAVSDVIILLKL